MLTDNRNDMFSWKHIYQQKDIFLNNNNIKIDLREVGWDGMVWIDLAQDRDQ
jgi:hypothetical protein